jgi:DNA-binding NtrC family response regulator
MSFRAVIFGSDSAEIATALESVLRRHGAQITAVRHEAALLEAIAHADVDLVIIEPKGLFNHDGIALTRSIRSHDARCPVLLFTQSSSERFAVEALRAGVSDLLPGDAVASEISEAVARLVGQTADASEGRDLMIDRSLIGRSPAARSVRVAIRQAARSDSNVLITGETGTGKELVADLIHRISSRAHRPMICVNSAAIPDTLLESELFGYERGAFTGAYSSTAGKLEQANGGTVFFDEIGDMSPYAQAKILRAIESREIQRLGGHSIRLNMRVLAATHRDLDRLSSDDRFRRDLYFRLNVARVHIPPLRERKSDIVPLIDHYIQEFNRRLRGNVRGLDAETLERLIDYDWPGNVRELRNVIESVFVARPAGPITFIDLPEWLRSRLANVTSNEQERILTALSSTNWNKSKAAESLHWSRMTLYRKMAKYRITSRDM